ncbi:MAG TPA: polysaccharide pyruvyl transferase family protein [Pseudomonas xinjiangensis]|uniref:Polysaccharide pyruvyl transferase family protein n=2 Tax=root TaxID=1 RepID=A0A7V1BLF4_9GAMM|nr:polysaccharide pyruvyl transferase family protein [Halopseudomonas xinjiangensis]HEC49020.1 polysaccharide pyruvyl transferase family protein [Halopseudomonas xinjiangensis]
MYVEVRKAGFVNKGAELMLRAVLQQLSREFPDAKAVMEPSRESGPYPYQGRAKLGLYQKAWLWRKGIPFGDLAGLVPPRIREQYGIVLDKEIDVVLDAAGFAYSDQWGAGLSEELARSASRWKKRGTKVILLPQAFGPFGDQRSRDAVKSFVDSADLIFAREPISYEYLTDVVGKVEHVKLSPDFTNLVQGIVPAYFNPELHQVCLVPNYRMMDKTSDAVAKGYVPFLQRTAKILLERGAKPFLLIHEGENDLKLAQQVSESVGGVPILREADPLAIKGILGACKGTVGSRFHGLVSALSQGVPSLATGWSHKYQMLFADYGFEKGVLDINLSDEELRSALDYVTDQQIMHDLSQRLQSKSDSLKAQSQAMWDEVFALMRQK